MALSGITQSVKAARPSELLFIISVIALIALDLAHFTLGTFAGAAALAAFAVAYTTRWHTSGFGFYGLVIAELSAIGLGADLTTVVAKPQPPSRKDPPPRNPPFIHPDMLPQNAKFNQF